jgi:hypothetical protein
VTVNLAPKKASTILIPNRTEPLVLPILCEVDQEATPFALSVITPYELVQMGQVFRLEETDEGISGNQREEDKKHVTDYFNYLHRAILRDEISEVRTILANIRPGIGRVTREGIVLEPAEYLAILDGQHGMGAYRRLIAAALDVRDPALKDKFSKFLHGTLVVIQVGMGWDEDTERAVFARMNGKQKALSTHVKAYLEGRIGSEDRMDQAAFEAADELAQKDQVLHGKVFFGIQGEKRTGKIPLVTLKKTIIKYLQSTDSELAVHQVSAFLAPLMDTFGEITKDKTWAPDSLIWENSSIWNALWMTRDIHSPEFLSYLKETLVARADKPSEAGSGLPVLKVISGGGGEGKGASNVAGEIRIIYAQWQEAVVTQAA